MEPKHHSWRRGHESVGDSTDSNPRGALHDAPGVAYSAFPGCQRRFFRCVAYSATLSREACRDRFLRAQDAKDDQLEPVVHCRTCAIGAAHAGRSVTFYSAHYRSIICPRCGKGTTRMIGNRRCVSCYNREREWKSGRNAKGTVPKHAKPVFRIGLEYVIDGTRRTYRGEVASTTEAILNVLRTVPGAIGFLPLVDRSQTSGAPR